MAPIFSLFPDLFFPLTKGKSRSFSNHKAVVSVQTLPSERIPVIQEKKQNRIRDFLEMIKFSHTVFALPFAYTGALMAGQGKISFAQFSWITLAMVGARTAGMSLNRLIDKEIDARNPRTTNRALPRGLFTSNFVWLIVAVSIALLFFSSLMLNPLCFYLSPVAVLLLFGYSYLKRYTWLSHLGLGLVLACAPIGGWIAVAGKLNAAPLWLGTAVIFWLAGFDILYACQDIQFDREFGLHSVPERFGVHKALWLSAASHFLTLIFLAAAGLAVGLSWPFGLGLGLIAMLLIYEHLLVTPNDLSKINQAFFAANAAISVIILLSTFCSYWIKL